MSNPRTTNSWRERSGIGAQLRQLATWVESLDDNDFQAVGNFHQKFGLDSVNNGVGPRAVPPELAVFRVKFLLEELREFVEALQAGDMVKAADALVDLSYVTLGTAQLYGLPWADLFAEVQLANMTKERATSPEQSARGSTFDVVKPTGWQPPNIEGVLRAWGWTDTDLKVPPVNIAIRTELTSWLPEHANEVTVVDYLDLTIHNDPPRED